MNPVTLTLFVTLAGVAFGMSVILCFIPRRALGPGFGKTICAIAFFCLLGPVLLAGSLLPAIESPSYLLAIRLTGLAALAVWFVYFIVMNYPREPAQRALVVLATLLQFAMIAFVGLQLGGHYFRGAMASAGGMAPLRTMTLTLGLFSSGLLTGSVTMAMMVGHWYLVIPGLDIKWLKGACLTFGAALGARTVAILTSLVVAALGHRYGVSGFIDDFRIHASLFFAMRAIVGLLVPAAFAVMAYRAAAIRATQSSTGILFPALVVVLIGEMIATSLIVGLGGLAV